MTQVRRIDNMKHWAKISPQPRAIPKLTMSKINWENLTIGILIWRHHQLWGFISYFTYCLMSEKSGEPFFIDNCLIQNGLESIAIFTLPAPVSIGIWWNENCCKNGQLCQWYKTAFLCLQDMFSFMYLNYSPNVNCSALYNDFGNRWKFTKKRHFMLNYLLQLLALFALCTCMSKGKISRRFTLQSKLMTLT